MIRRILSLTSKDFVRGISVGSYYEHAGIFDVAQGIDFTRSPGLLTAGYSAVEISATINEAIVSMDTDPTNDYLWAYGDANSIWRITMTTNGPVVELTPGDVGTAAPKGNGIIYNNEYIYTQKTQIGKATGIGGASPTFNSTAVAVTITSSDYHPTFIGPDGKLYIGADGAENSANYIGRYDGTTHNSAVLDLPVGYVPTCFETDGKYLIIGATRSPGNVTGNFSSKVFFWDMWSPSWNHEWSLGNGVINSLKRLGNWIYAFNQRSLQALTFKDAPARILTKAITNILFNVQHGGADEFRGQLGWGEEHGWTYGSIDKRLSPIINNPFKLPTGNTVASSFKTISPTKVYIGTMGTTDRLYSFSTGNETATATTALIDLGRPWKITGIKITRKDAAGSVVAAVQDAGGNNIISGTFDETTILSKMLKDPGNVSNVTEQIIIDLDLTGSIEIKKVEVFGELVEISHADLR